MEPSNGFRSSPVSPSRRQSWSRPSPLPEDTIPHESMNYGSYYEHRIDANEQQQQQRVLSQASELDSPVYTPGELDDRVHLTSQNTVWKRSAPYERDLERRRKSGRAVDRNAGGQHSSGALKAMSKSIKRASIRVVNFAGADMDDRPVRLDDVDDHDRPIEPPLTTLRGKTLGIFGPMNPLRLAMHKLLTSTFTEAIILLLIILNAAILTVQSVHNAFLDTPDGAGYFRSWEDLVLFGLFVIYTLEAISRIIVSGLLVDPEIPFGTLRMPISNLQRQGSFTSRISNIRPRFMYNGASPRPQNSTLGTGPGGGSTTALTDPSASTPSAGMWDSKKETPTTTPGSSRIGVGAGSQSTGSRIAAQLSAQDLPFKMALNKQLDITSTSRPYLRHSWNRVDTVAIISFWIMFALCAFGLEKRASEHLYLFRALSVLRTTRLLAITSGTTTIMTSLKKAAPQLVNVAAFVLFAIILFSIVGVQSFGGSFRRNCAVVENGIQTIQLGQQCGRFFDPETLAIRGYITVNGAITESFKGFTCPFGQVCQETLVNPQSNAEQFDNIFGAALQIIIVASANGWAKNMYAMMDSEFFVSFIFFIICVIVLNFWLLNLFVAVITQSFGASRAETKRSAFGAEGDLVPQLFDEDKDGRWDADKENALQRVYRFVEPFFALLALASLTLQAIRTTSTPQRIINITLLCEYGITTAFVVEIIWRISASFPRWRNFFSKKQNIADLFLAIACSVILIPFIQISQAYPWLTAFQLMRFYRVILLVPGMRTLLFQVFGNMRGLLNMTIFLMLANYLAALFAVQLFRSDVPANINMNFQGIVTSFLAMYQVFTSENWTDVMWNVSNAEFPFRQQIIAILFVVTWFFFANFIMLQMFIAVINENFEVAEEEKRAQQVHAYIRRAEPTATTINWLDRLNPYRRMKANPRAINVDALPENLVLPLKKSVVREYRNPGESSTLHTTRGIADMPIIQGPLGTMRKFMGMDQDRENVPLTHIRGNRPQSEVMRSTFELDETERHLEAINAVNHDTVAEDNRDALLEARARQADFINDHPSYDKTLWVFTQNNKIRQWCQRVVPPSNGDDKERIYGFPPSPWLEFGFRAIMLITVIAGIIIAGVAGPLYRRGYFSAFPTITVAWFDTAEAVFGFLLVGEFLIKIVADGFIFTPNAYMLNIWNILDLVILIAILVNVITSLAVVGGLSRGTRALKAFRALRLITLLGWMRETFHSVIIAGARRIVDAAVLALLYMVPYAVWGLNIFSGRLVSCNDGNALGADDCQNEYMASPVDGSLSFLAPRVWDNPSPSTSFSFDSFGQSFLILFEIVSLEGWTDVLKAALGITGFNKQPSINASQINALFFVLYNLLGAVVILTLFVSIIISNFSSRSGMALLTAEQRQWIDLKKLISRQKPSKRPHIRPTGKFQSWCFDRAVKKRGWWSSGMTFLYCVQIGVLMSSTFTDSDVSDKARDFTYLALAVCFLADPFVKFIGLGWRSFRSNGWNIFDVVVILGSIGTTLVTILDLRGFSVRQAQKLFLVCVAFKLMQKLDGLNQLFKTAVSSLGVIAKLFGLWFSLFLFFGILWLEVFALTKWGSGENENQNYQSLGRTLIMLAFMSTGEQWNQYMHDYAISFPRCTNSKSSLEESDCGSIGWSFTLFMSWNVLSMYIFVNMFTGVVVENFSYIYQQRRNQTLNREEMRAFKKVWAQFDQSSTGYLDRNNIVPFLAKLTGVFEVRIYPASYNFRVLYEDSKASASDPFVPGTRVGPLDLRRLDRNLEGLDHDAVRRRRKLYNRVFWEARLLAQENTRGIPFSSMLLMLTHHKLIDDDKALKVEELLRRRAITEQVEDRVNFDKVRTLFRMIYLRKKFLAKMEEKRRGWRNTDVPEIVVAEPVSPQLRTWDITRAHLQGHGPHDSMGTIDLDSPSPTGRAFNVPNLDLFQSNSPFQPTTTQPPDHIGSNPFIEHNANPHSNPYGTLPNDPWGGTVTGVQPLSPSAGTWSDPASPSSRSRNPYRASDVSMLSHGSRSPRNHSPSGSPGRADRTMSLAEDPNAVLNALNNSVWGEMMEGVEEEEEEPRSR